MKKTIIALCLVMGSAHSMSIPAKPNFDSVTCQTVNQVSGDLDKRIPEKLTVNANGNGSAEIVLGGDESVHMTDFQTPVYPHHLDTTQSHGDRGDYRYEMSVLNPFTKASIKGSVLLRATRSNGAEVFTLEATDCAFQFSEASRAMYSEYLTAQLHMNGSRILLRLEHEQGRFLNIKESEQTFTITSSVGSDGSVTYTTTERIFDVDAKRWITRQIRNTYR